ncbi:cyclic nucleotide-gated ion channel 1 [Tanacetum coccineum]
MTADDLKFVASQFRRLHNKQLRHTFRFYLQQWRTWAACFIRAAWCRHCRKKLEDSLSEEEEDRLQNALTGAGGSSPSLGATIYASRFEDWKSEKSSNGGSPQRFKTALDSVSNMFRKSFEHGSGGIKSLKQSIESRSLNRLLSRGLGSGRKTLNPQGKFLQKWNKIFVLSCVIAVSVDPLFFYIPIVKDVKKCLDLDNKLQITASVLRSFTDIFYIVHIIFQFRTGFIAPSSRVFGRGVLVEDAWEIAKRYMSSYFLVDILAVLPLLPQVRESTLNYSCDLANYTEDARCKILEYEKLVEEMKLIKNSVDEDGVLFVAKGRLLIWVKGLFVVETGCYRLGTGQMTIDSKSVVDGTELKQKSREEPVKTNIVVSELNMVHALISISRQGLNRKAEFESPEHEESEDVDEFAVKYRTISQYHANHWGITDCLKSLSNLRTWTSNDCGKEVVEIEAHEKKECKGMGRGGDFLMKIEGNSS